MSDGGKGSARRKPEVPDEVVKSNWETIFGKKPVKEEPKEKKDEK